MRCFKRIPALIIAGVMGITYTCNSVPIFAFDRSNGNKSCDTTISGLTDLMAGGSINSFQFSEKTTSMGIVQKTEEVPIETVTSGAIQETEEAPIETVTSGAIQETEEPPIESEAPGGVVPTKEVPTPTPTNDAMAMPDSTYISKQTEAPNKGPIETKTPTKEPVQTKTPVETKTPTKAPVQTKTPIETKAPTKEPVQTKTPVETKAPTKAPVQTKTPIETKAPTKGPVQTKAPVETKAPTKGPVETKGPVQTKAPTKEPVQTKIPITTDIPMYTQLPANTIKPDTPIKETVHPASTTVAERTSSPIQTLAPIQTLLPTTSSPVTTAKPVDSISNVSNPTATPALDKDKKKEYCQITYQLDGGKNHKKNPNKIKKRGVNVVLNAPSKAKYIFDGWYTDKKYTHKVSVVGNTSLSFLTLYAKWKKVTVRQVTFTVIKKKDENSIFVKVKKEGGVEGFEYVYAKDSYFRRKCRLRTKKNPKILSKLTKKKKYYIKVRAYKLDSTGKKIYGVYSRIEKIRL